MKDATPQMTHAKNTNVRSVEYRSQGGWDGMGWDGRGVYHAWEK